MTCRHRSLAEQRTLEPLRHSCIDDLFSQGRTFWLGQRGAVMAGLDRIRVAEAPLVVTGVVEIFEQAMFIRSALSFAAATDLLRPITQVEVQAENGGRTVETDQIRHRPDGRQIAI